MSGTPVKIALLLGGSAFGALVATGYHRQQATAAANRHTPPPPAPGRPAGVPPPAPPVAAIPPTNYPSAVRPFEADQVGSPAVVIPPPVDKSAGQTLQTLREVGAKVGFPESEVTYSVLDLLGNPGPVSETGKHEAFVSSYNRQLRNPNWVFEHLTKSNLHRDSGEDPDRTNSTFREDTQIPLMFRGRLRDYLKSGYDRGHLAPAADAKRSQQAMDETFLLSNMCPQVGTGFNRDYWAHFEMFTRKLTREFSDVYVFTGPLYLPKPMPGSPGKYKVEYEVIGSPPNIAVPTHFYKVMLVRDGQGKYAVGSFVLPNAVIPNETPLESFVSPVSAVEKAAGLTFFDKVPEIQPPNVVTPLCSATKCSLVEALAFVEAAKQRKALKAPAQDPSKGRRNSV